MIIAFVRANNYGSEPRLINFYTVAQQVSSPKLILWNRSGSNVTKESNSEILSIKAPFGKKVIFLLPIWFIFSFISLIKINPQIVHACNIDSVLPSWAYTKLFRRRLIYDIWDTTGGMFAGNSSKMLNFCNRVDIFFIRQADFVIVPDIARFTQLGLESLDTLKNKYLVAYNSFPINAKLDKKIDLHLQSIIKLSYVGVLSKRIRGIEGLIRTVSENPRFTLDIAGYGPDELFFTSLFDRSKYKNITYHGSIDYKKSREINARSDIVICLLDPNFANYRYATSTKIFEAFSLGKPVITTKGTASSTLVDSVGWGVSIAFTENALQSALQQIADGSLSFILQGNQVIKYGWEHIADEVALLYKRLENSNKTNEDLILRGK